MNDENRDQMDSGTWERVYGTRPKMLRLRVPGGWLVTITGGLSYPVTFYPGPDHQWNPPVKQ
jgi:hypothetical protein